MRLRIAIGAVVLATLALGAGAARAADPFRVGFIGGMTGYLVDLDLGARDGLAIAIDEINKGGGLLGRKLELVVEDNRSEPAASVTALNKLLISTKVDLVFGGASSAGTRAMSPIIVRRKIPVFVMSILPGEEDKEGLRWIFTGSPLTVWDLETRLAYMKKRGWTRVGLIHDTTPYATTLAVQAEKSAPASGITILAKEQYSPDVTDLRPQLTKLKTAGAQAIFQVGAGPAIGILAKTLKEMGFAVPHLADSNTNPLEVVKIAGPAAQGVMYAALPQNYYDSLGPTDPRRLAARAFMEEWRSRFGKERSPSFAARAYDAMMIVAEAVRQAKGTDGTAVRDAIEHIKDFRGAMATRAFSPENHVGMDRSPFLLVEIQSNASVKLLD
jgi:branched-chain amino acid transport system substrate-binding protein